MNEFVEECRREWRRLGVRRAVADDMAAELHADVAEAESLEDALGAAAASDPRSFARAWASERGVLPRRGTVRIPAVLAALALIPAIAGSVLLVEASESKEQRVAAPPALLVVSPPASPGTWVGPPLVSRAPTQQAQAVRAEAQAQALFAERSARTAAASSKGPDDTTRMAGIVLLLVGLAVLAALTLLQLRRPDAAV